MADTALPPLSRRRLLAGSLLIAFVVLCAFWPALSASFVYDDLLLLGRSPAITTLSSMPDLVLHSTWDTYGPTAGASVGYWRPLASFVHALVYAASGPNPAAFHAASLAIHVAACIGAWALARRIAKNELVAFATAVLFALHPIHVEGVAWVSAVGEPLYALFAFAALSRFLAWRERGSIGSPWGAGALLVPALLSKELAVAVIPAAIALDLVLDMRPRAWKRAYLPFVSAFALYFVARMFIFQSPWAGLDRTTTQFGVGPARLALLRVEIVGGLMRLLVWPTDLRLFHPFVPDLASARLGIPVFTCAAWIALCVFLWRRKERRMLAAAVLAPVVLLPLVVRVQALGEFPLSERYAYFAALGVVLCVALALVRALPHALAIAALSLLALIFGIATNTRARVWHDEETLLAATVHESPRVPSARWQYGRILLERYRKANDIEALAQAHAEFQTALDLLESTQKGDETLFSTVEDHVQANLGLGWVLMQEAEISEAPDYKDAVAVFTATTSRYPKRAEAWTGLGVAQFAHGDVDAAEKSFKKAIELDERFVEAHKNLGDLQMSRGDWTGARASFENALRWQPDGVDTILLLGATMERGGDDARSTELFERAARLAPQDARPHVQLARLAAKHGDLASAETRLAHAVDIDAKSGEAWLERGKVQALRGEKNAGLASLQRACDLLPKNFEAHYDAGGLLLELQGAPQAIPYLTRAYELRPTGKSGDALAATLKTLPIESPETYVTLATTDADHHDVDGALAWVDRALKLDVKSGKAHFLRGGLLKTKGDQAEAKVEWELACALMPDSLAAHEAAAQLAIEMKDRDLAISHLKKALEIAQHAAAGNPELAPAVKGIEDQIKALESETK